MFLVKSSGMSFLNPPHSVTSMQQSVFLMQPIAEKANLILFLDMVFAAGIAIGS
jgi:hypothetical protein